MQFRILGPLEVEDGGRSLTPRGAKPRSLLALLLVHANEPVAAERLIEELWPGELPANAAKTLQIHVSRVRKALGDGRLATLPAGYRLQVGDDELDRTLAERLLERGQGELAEGRAGTAAATFGEALALFRGPPLGEFAYEPFAQAEIAQLEELRFRLVEGRVDADLARGRHGAVVPELERLVAENPLRERPRGQLMVALYRSGRQVDALAVYADYRRRLDDELGLAPGPGLRALERRILEHDPALDPPAGAATRPARPHGRRVHRRRTVLGVAAVLGGVAVVAAALAFRPAGDAAVPARSLAVVDAERGTLEAAVPLQGAPTDVVTGRRAVFVAVPATRSVVAVEPRSRASLAIGASLRPTRLAVAPGVVWTVAGVARRFARLGSDRVYGLGGAEPAIDAVAADARSVWLAERATSGVTRFDVATSRMTWLPIRGADSFIEGDAERAVALAAGSAWVTNPVTQYPHQDRIGRVARIDAATGRVLRRIRVPAPPLAIAADDRAVWVVLERGEDLWRIDTADEVASAAVRVPGGAVDVAVDGEAVWVLGRDGAVSRIDPATNAAVARTELGRPGVAIAAGHGSVWVAVP